MSHGQGSVISTKNIDNLIKEAKQAAKMKQGNIYLDAYVRALKDQSDRYEWAKVKRLIDSLDEFIN